MRYYLYNRTANNTDSVAVTRSDAPTSMEEQVKNGGTQSFNVRARPKTSKEKKERVSWEVRTLWPSLTVTHPHTKPIQPIPEKF